MTVSIPFDQYTQQTTIARGNISFNFIFLLVVIYLENKDENVHRYAVRGKKDREWEIGRECVWERER